MKPKNKFKGYTWIKEDDDGTPIIDLSLLAKDFGMSKTIARRFTAKFADKRGLKQPIFIERD